MKRKKVRVVTNWCSSFDIHDRIIDQFCADKTTLGFEFTASDDYDYLVAFNDMRGFTPLVPKSNILGFIQEPPNHAHFYDTKLADSCELVYTCAAPHQYPVYSDNMKGFPCGMFFHMGGDILDYFGKPEKTKDVSMITSGIRGGFYEHRRNLASYLHRSGTADVFGRGLSTGKGTLQNKADGLMPYKFSVCMENGIYEGYISDKIIDAVLCDAIPIYVGAPDVAAFIPFAIVLDNFTNPKRAAADIKEIIQSVNYDAIYPKMQAFKKLYLSKHSILTKINEFVK